jgi:hypothetical protein
MNSDNTLLGGRTIDYGPFGWMEKYDPMYQPFTSVCICMHIYNDICMFDLFRSEIHVYINDICIVFDLCPTRQGVMILCIIHLHWCVYVCIDAYIYVYMYLIYMYYMYEFIYI